MHMCHAHTVYVANGLNAHVPRPHCIHGKMVSCEQRVGAALHSKDTNSGAFFFGAPGLPFPHPCSGYHFSWIEMRFERHAIYNKLATSRLIIQNEIVTFNLCNILGWKFSPMSIL